MDELNWTSEDVDIFRGFFTTRTGQKFLPVLAERVPTLLDGGDINRTLVRNGEVRGYQAALKEIYFLAFPPPLPEPEQSEYPSLLDDKAWQDGQKIEPSTQQ